MAENTIANRALFIVANFDVLRGMNSATVDLICNSIRNARIMPLEQLREATKARGTHVSRSGEG